MRRSRVLGVVLALPVFFLVSSLVDFWEDWRPCPLRGQAEPALFPAPPTLRRSGSALAVSQWSRKYKTACATCHTVFPRLNYYGERFARNGYQDLNAAEPAEVGLGNVEDWFGARVSLSPVEYQAKGLTVNGSKRGLWSFGKTPWLQLFTATSITRNISFFDELQLGATARQAFEVEHGWFRIGFHNLLGPKGLVNIRAGRL